jgi:transcriptional regulator with XRE-family HTH domain
MPKMEIISDAFSTRLKACRGEKNKAVFAKFLNLTAPTYQRYEGGRIPKTDILWQIARKCNVSVAYLLGQSDDPSPNEREVGVQTEEVWTSNKSKGECGRSTLSAAVIKHPPPSDPWSRDVMTQGFRDAYDRFIALPDGKRYLGWISTASLHAAESAEAFHAGDATTGQAKAYRAHAVFDRIFKTAEEGHAASLDAKPTNERTSG